MLAASPALKSVSSVRHTDPPTPFVCAVAEISVRCVAAGGGVAGMLLATLTTFEVTELSLLRYAVSVTV